MQDKYIMTPEITKNICTTLGCSPDQIQNFQPAATQGASNFTFSFNFENTTYYYRQPSSNTHGFVNRKAELFAEKKAKKLGVNKTFIAMCPDTGWKLSYFVDNCVEADCRDLVFQKKALTLLHKFHEDGEKSPYDFPFKSESKVFLKTIITNKPDQKQALLDENKKMNLLYDALEADGVKKCLCHNDTWNVNYLYNDHNIDLIDWEFASNNDPAFDVANFGLMADFTVEETLQVYENYLGRPYTEKERKHFLGHCTLAFYVWQLWAMWKEAIGHEKDVLGLVALWKKQCNQFAQLSLPAYKILVVSNSF